MQVFSLQWKQIKICETIWNINEETKLMKLEWNPITFQEWFLTHYTSVVWVCKIRGKILNYLI